LSDCQRYTVTVTDNTEELRDIFKDVAEEDTVTETQEESRGSLTEDRASEDRLIGIFDRMRVDHDFDTDLPDADLATVVQRFYGGSGDTAIAEDLDVSRREVVGARLDLHLIRDRDTDAPFDLDTLREHLDAERSTAEIADALDVSASTVRRYSRVVEAQNEARRASHRFRSEFEDVLVEAEMREQFTEDIAEDGLEDATEGTETNVSF
jgi:DNA-directed RNA polymerase specialized sigma24 family protein